MALTTRRKCLLSGAAALADMRSGGLAAKLIGGNFMRLLAAVQAA